MNDILSIPLASRNRHGQANAPPVQLELASFAKELDSQLGLLPINERFAHFTAVLNSNVQVKNNIDALCKASMVPRRYNILKYLQCTSLSTLWHSQEVRHAFLALSYNASWFFKRFWDEQEESIDWKVYKWLIFRADNADLAVKVFLGGPKSRAETAKVGMAILDSIIKYDSAMIAEKFFPNFGILEASFNRLVLNDCIAIIKTLFIQTGRLRSTLLLEEVITHRSVFEFLHSKGLYREPPSKDFFKKLVLEPNIEMLEYIYKIYKQLPPMDIVMESVRQGRHSVLEWQIKIGWKPSVELVDVAVRNGDIIVISFLAKKFQLKFTQSAVDDALRSGKIRVLTRLRRLSTKWRPSAAAINDVISDGKVAVLRWLLEAGTVQVNPSLDYQKLIDNAVSGGDMIILQWLSQLDIIPIPSYQSIAAALMAGRSDIVDWIFLNCPDQLETDELIEAVSQVPSGDMQKGINVAAVCGLTDLMLSFHSSHELIIPDDISRNEAASRGYEDIVEVIDRWKNPQPPPVRILTADYMQATNDKPWGLWDLEPPVYMRYLKY